MTVALFLIGGLVLLTIGGELLVRGAVQVAQRVGVSPLVIGLTLVGFGTSMPELVTSVQAALVGSPGIAVGNIVGSNIANILLILGVAAVIFPVSVSSIALKRDGVVVVATAVSLCAVGLFWTLDRMVGAFFVAALVTYVSAAWRQEKVETGGHTAAYEKAEAAEGLRRSRLQRSGSATPPGTAARMFASVGLALGGLILLILGGKLLVDGAVALARSLGAPETVIGLTIVAVGTSMPELVTSTVAAVRRQADVALGNVLGSNIYNVLGIGGATALIAPTSIPPEIARFDNPIMLAVSLVLMLFAWTGWRIGRREGVVLLVGYAAYLWALWPA